MKLKEAQVLGILAFIAAGIIILCMWGGGRKQQLVSPRQGGSLGSVPGEGDTTALEDLIDRMDREARGEVEPPPAGPLVPPAPPVIPNPEPVEPRTPPAPKTHVVQKGDTLSGISRQYYNTPGKWKVIWEANRHLIGARPEDLRPQMKLVIPPLEEHGQAVPRDLGSGTSEVVWAGQTRTLSAEERASGAKLYDVQPGDTLWEIAEKFYDDGTAWKKILEANQDVLDDPKDLRQNMQLILP